MHKRAYGFAALLAVIGVSIVFGMIIGGKLNAPQVVYASPQAPPIELAPAKTSAGFVLTDFADIVEQALPAVVAVTSAQLADGETTSQSHPFFNDPFFRRFFGYPEEDGDEPQQRPQPQQPRIGEGSGFIISADGFILTNNHVVEDSDQVKVSLENGDTYDAEVVGTDPSIDLALLKIDAEDLPTLSLGDSERLRVGEWVIAIGNPLEFQQTVTVGVVSGKERRLPLGSTDRAVVSFIQTDAAINFGNSGGPLLDARGNVVGINTAINRQFLAEGIGFALPISQVRNVVDQLRERGYVRRGFIGITMNNPGIDKAAREFYSLPDNNGVIISEVHEGPGKKAGLKAGDIIRRVDGAVVENNFDLVSKIASHQPGDQVNLEIYRKGGRRSDTLEFTVTLADRDEGRELRAGRPRVREPDPEPEIEAATGFGLTLENLNPRNRQTLGIAGSQKGVVITDVEYDSIAANKGFRPNMIIVSLNDESVEDVSDWSRLLDDLGPGASFKLEVFAAGQPTLFFLTVPDDGD